MVFLATLLSHKEVLKTYDQHLRVNQEDSQQHKGDQKTIFFFDKSRQVNEHQEKWTEIK